MAFTANSSSTAAEPEKPQNGALPPQGMDLEHDLRWLAVRRIVATESFAKASRLSAFLLYVSQKSLLGRTDEISEQQIGIYVFSRPANYNPGDDNIVRQTARQLRQRLALFYQEEGRGEKIRVSVPKGGYAPHFEELAPVRPDSAGTSVGTQDGLGNDQPVPRGFTARVEPAEPARTNRRLSTIALLVTGIIVGITLTILGFFFFNRVQYSANETSKLWSLLFQPHVRTLIVPGDAGLNLYENLSRQQVDVRNYSSESYLRAPLAQTPSGFTWAPLAARNYTTLADLSLVVHLMELHVAHPELRGIRFAREITLDDLKNSNAILIGAPNYDPWIQLFEKHLDIIMHYNGEENSISVIDKAPRKGELPFYKWSETDLSRAGYGAIILTDNLDKTGKVLIVEGTTMGGVAAATDFLFRPSSMDPIVRQALDANGAIGNFEVLLGTTFYSGNNGGTLNATILAKHFHLR